MSLEYLDARLAPSDVPLPGDPPPTPPGTPVIVDPNLIPVGAGGQTNVPPRITNFTAVEVVGGMWRFTGDVVDEAPGGLTICFGGEPDSLQGRTTTTDANGHFDVSILVSTDGSDNGLATAQTTDNAGQLSNLALYNIMPG